MTPFTTHTGTTAIIDRSNIDTDQIISKEHLKSIKRTGFGPSLFSDWRYLPDGKENPAFELNRPEYKGATILIAGNNFGCGSSREHAVWAIAQFGFRAVIAPSRISGNSIIPAFADIFRGNAAKNGLLLIELDEPTWATLKNQIAANPKLGMTIILEKQEIQILYNKISFQIDTGTKKILLEGLDDIAMSLKYKEAIATFEKGHDVQMAKATQFT